VDLAHFDSPEHLIEDEQDDQEENIMNLIGADGSKPRATAMATDNQAHDDSFCNIVELQGGGDIGQLDEELINFQPALEEEEDPKNHSFMEYGDQAEAMDGAGAKRGTKAS